MNRRNYLSLRIKILLSRGGPAYIWLRRLRALTRYLLRRPHDPDFRVFGSIKGDGLFLDVGASVGQSAYSFRIFNRSSPILSLEPLPEHQGDLRFVSKVLRGFDFLPFGAGKEAGNFPLYVPQIRDYALPAETSLDRSNAASVLDQLCAKGFSRSELTLRIVQSELIAIDDLHLNPAFVKVDVEGLELEVLEGMMDTIRSTRPLIMLEHSASTSHVIQLLMPLGYSCVVANSSGAGFDSYHGQRCTNVFFLPSNLASRASRE